MCDCDQEIDAKNMEEDCREISEYPSVDFCSLEHRRSLVGWIQNLEEDFQPPKLSFKQIKSLLKSELQKSCVLLEKEKVRQLSRQRRLRKAYTVS